MAQWFKHLAWVQSLPQELPHDISADKKKKKKIIKKFNKNRTSVIDFPLLPLVLLCIALFLILSLFKMLVFFSSWIFALT